MCRLPIHTQAKPPAGLPGQEGTKSGPSRDQVTPQVTPHVTPHVRRLLAVIGGEMTRDGLLDALGLSDRKSFREIYLEPAIKQGLVEMTIPDKPKSILQKYRLTAKGRAVT